MGYHIDKYNLPIYYLQQALRDINFISHWKPLETRQSIPLKNLLLRGIDC